jgi:hypothetical protein
MNPEETIQIKELCLEIIAERDEARYPELLRRLDAIFEKAQARRDPTVPEDPTRHEAA